MRYRQQKQETTTNKLIPNPMQLRDLRLACFRMVLNSFTEDASSAFDLSLEGVRKERASKRRGGMEKSTV